MPRPALRPLSGSPALRPEAAALVLATALLAGPIGAARAGDGAAVDPPAAADTPTPRGEALEAALRARLESRVRARGEDRTHWLVGASLQADAIAGTRRLDGAEQDTLTVSAIPFGDAPSVTRASIRTSQVDGAAWTPVGGGHRVWTRVQANLFGPDGSTRPRLTLGFVRLDDVLLVGRTHSTFMDDAALPTTLDYNGPSGVTFVRQPMVRASLRPLEAVRLDASVETPQADARIGADGVGEVRVSAARPDLAARLRVEGEAGHLQLAGLWRRLDVSAVAGPAQAPVASTTRRVAGRGVSLSGSVALGGADTLSGQWVRGEAIGRYFNDGVSASGVAAGGDLTVVPLTLTGTTLYWRHAWPDGWTSTVGASRLVADADGGRRDPGALRALTYASATLVRRVSPTVFAGVELQRGEAAAVDGARATTTRVQLSVRWLVF